VYPCKRGAWECRTRNASEMTLPVYCQTPQPQCDKMSSTVDFSSLQLQRCANLYLVVL
jgi:hypothetical protein